MPIAFKSNPDKSMLDAPTYREHWNPKFLQFEAMDNGPRSLVLREAVRQCKALLLQEKSPAVTSAFSS